MLLLRTRLSVAAHLSRDPADATWPCRLVEGGRHLWSSKLQISFAAECATISVYASFVIRIVEACEQSVTDGVAKGPSALNRPRPPLVPMWWKARAAHTGERTYKEDKLGLPFCFHWSPPDQ